MSKNIYLKEAASKILNIGNTSLQTINNLLSVNKASTQIDVNSEQLKCTCAGKPRLADNQIKHAVNKMCIYIHDLNSFELIAEI